MCGPLSTKLALIVEPDPWNLGAIWLFCEAAGFARSRENPACQAPSYQSVSAPKVVRASFEGLLEATDVVLGVPTALIVHGSDSS